MSGTDSIVINVRERPLSSDINNLQSLTARTLMNLMRSLGGAKFFGVPGVELPINSYPAGLVPSIAPSGVDIQIGPGILLQDSLTLSPVPTTLDSQFRFGSNSASSVVLMPSPVVETFYLIEAQVAPVVVDTASRDILDPGTGNFVPTLVTKEIDYQVQFQLLTGGADAPAPSGGDWVPLCIVRRPAGGGPIVATDIIDVRTITDHGGPRPNAPLLRRCTVRSGSFPGAANNQHEVRAEIDGPFGVRKRDDLITFTDFGDASVLSPATVFAADTWFYAYLCGWSAGLLNPSPAATALRQTVGVFVVSDVAPDAFRRNSAPITLPSPYNLTTAPATTAYCVGAFRRNLLNTGFVTTNIYEDAAVMTNLRVQQNVSGAGVPAFNSTVNLAGFYPVGARSVRVSIQTDAGGLAGALVNTGYDLFISAVTATTYRKESLGLFDAIELDLPVASLGDQYDMLLSFNPVGATGTITLIVDVIGWNW